MAGNMIDYFVVCETTISDEDSRVSLINIFDTINTKTLPLRSDKFYVAFSVFLDAKTVVKKSEMKIVFTQKSNKNDIYTATTDIKPFNNKGGYGLVKLTSGLNIGNDIQFDEPGFYIYTLYVNDVQIVHNEFRVRKEQ